MWDLPVPGLNPCVLHWQENSLPLSHQGSQMALLLSTVPISIWQQKYNLFISNGCMLTQSFQGCAQSSWGFVPFLLSRVTTISWAYVIMALSGSWGGWRLSGPPWSTPIFLNCSSRQVDLTPTSCELSSLISTVPVDVYVCPWSLAWIVQVLLGSFGSVYHIPQPTVCLSRPSLSNLQTKHRFSSLSELPNLSGGPILPLSLGRGGWGRKWESLFSEIHPSS